jgi:hypothetical protein
LAEQMFAGPVRAHACSRVAIGWVTVLPLMLVPLMLVPLMPLPLIAVYL